MRNGGLMTFAEVLADNQRRAKIVVAMPQRAPRALADLRIDEMNIAASRCVYFNLACDKAKSHMNAAVHLDEMVALSIQETALRDAADMLASRIDVGLRKRERESGRKQDS